MLFLDFNNKIVKSTLMKLCRNIHVNIAQCVNIMILMVEDFIMGQSPNYGRNSNFFLYTND